MERGGGVGLILDASSVTAATTTTTTSSSAATAFSTNPNRVLDEMDFFSTEKKKKPSSALDSDLKVPSLSNNGYHHHLNVNTGLHLLTSSSGSDRLAGDDRVSSNEEDRESRNDQLPVMQAELCKLKEENQRLKGMLSQVTGNYNSLHMQFITFMQQKNQRNMNGSTQMQQKAIDEKMDVKKQSTVPRQFMDLGLASADNEEDLSMDNGGGSMERSICPNNFEGQSINHRNGMNKGSSFRKDTGPFEQGKPQIVREESPEQSSQGWVPNKTPKLSSSSNSEQTQEATMRKARVSIRARSEAPTISDGCQWRKYGQKMAKGNPCPRAYYRCTVAVGCPVRKQVQRCAEDRTILITTYEGNHNHPLPPAAVAMASTTSAAATMLLSGSMSSADSIMNPDFLAKTMLTCSSSLSTISASVPFPTVTLDLTQSPNPLQAQRPAAQLQLALPNGASNFGSSSPPQIFGQSLGSQSKFSGLQMSSSGGLEQKPLVLAADMVSAATAAITSDPNFTAALAAAITSIIGNGGAGIIRQATASALETAEMKLLN